MAAAPGTGQARGGSDADLPPHRRPETPRAESARAPTLDSVQAAAMDYGPGAFFARQTYRRRRLMDAARMVPAFGAALFLLPTIWISHDTPAHTSSGFVYLFAVWALLILVGFVVARRIMAPLPNTAPQATADIARRVAPASGAAPDEAATAGRD